MTDAALIERIVRTVLAELRDAATPESFSSCFLILGKHKDTDMDKLNAYLPAGAATVFLEDLPGQRVPVLNGASEGEYQGIILPSLSMTAMADLALGRATGKTCRQVLELLMGGHRVGVLDFEYERFRETAPPALWQLYESYRSTLEAFGLAEMTPAGDTCRTLRKNLVTEADIRPLKGQGVSTLRIEQQTIVTGLAQDLACSLGMEIQRF